MAGKSRRYFDPENRRLVYIREAADEGFWDRQWAGFDLEGLLRDPPPNPHNQFIREATRRFLPHGGRILEGGCGLGDKVALLSQDGFDVVGVDWAENTVARVQAAAPWLTFVQDDVRALSYPDSTFDGYWSLGVIEHFYSGYEEIRDESFRVLKPGGFLFLTFPSMSPLRSFKGKVGLFPRWSEREQRLRGFYQFALDPHSVSSDFQRHGFELVEERPLNGIKGLSDEVPFLETPLKVLYKLAYRPTEFLAGRVANHAHFLVLRKPVREGGGR